MSLDFDVSRVKDYATVTTHPEDIGKQRQRWHPVTDSLIWKTMSIDLGEISAKNIDEWCFRVRLLQLLDGPDFKTSDDDKPVYITRKDIEMHIGLATNVISKPRKKWLERLFKTHRFSGPAQDKSAHEIMADLHAADVAKEKEKENEGTKVGEVGHIS